MINIWSDLRVIFIIAIMEIDFHHMKKSNRYQNEKKNLRSSILKYAENNNTHLRKSSPIYFVVVPNNRLACIYIYIDYVSSMYCETRDYICWVCGMCEISSCAKFFFLNKMRKMITRTSRMTECKQNNINKTTLSLRMLFNWLVGSIRVKI